MGELLKTGYWSNWWMELGGGKNTSGSILKHFLSCRWQIPYIWGHDPLIKWDQSRWLIKWQLTQKRPRQSFKSTQWRELRLLRYFPERIHSGECYSGNSLRKEGKTVRKLFWEECCSNLVITACSWENYW